MSHERPDNTHETLELAALYLAGALAPDEEQAVEQRLKDGDPSLREAIRALDPAARGILDSVDPVTPEPSVRKQLLDRIAADSEASGLDTHHDHDHAVWDDWASDDDGSLFTLPAAAGRWESTGIDGIEVRRLFVDRKANRMTAMFRMAPGTSYVPHVHDGAEECYVLEGDLHVGEDIVMHAGDYQRAPAGSLHGRQWTSGGCVLLINSSLSDQQVYTDGEATDN